MSPTARKTVLVIVATVCAIVVVFLVCISPLLLTILKDGFRSHRQQQELLTRSDYPEIAAACVAMSRAVTNGSFLVHPTNNLAVPALLRSLSPNYITVRDGFINLEFHGGFDHYGYRVESGGSHQWTIFYYTEESKKPLATITK